MTMIAVRAARSEDKTAWLPLWHGYCAFYNTAIPAPVTEATWARIHDPAQPFGCLVACGEGDRLLGFAVYVLHPNTWSTQTLCYLEDLFVAEDARGLGAGRALIEALAALGRREKWLRIYWMTKKDNARARALYDRLTPATDWVRYDMPLTP
jgi:GNAT superfamily N-acetyltransferase